MYLGTICGYSSENHKLHFRKWKGNIIFDVAELNTPKSEGRTDGVILIFSIIIEILFNKCYTKGTLIDILFKYKITLETLYRIKRFPGTNMHNLHSFLHFSRIVFMASHHCKLLLR